MKGNDMMKIYEVNRKYLYRDIGDAIIMAKTILRERVYNEYRTEHYKFAVNKNSKKNYSVQLIAPWIWVGNKNLLTVIITTRTLN